MISGLSELRGVDTLHPNKVMNTLDLVELYG